MVGRMSAHLIARLAAWWPRESNATTLATSERCGACEALHAVSVDADALSAGRAQAEQRRLDCEWEASPQLGLFDATGNERRET